MLHVGKTVLIGILLAVWIGVCGGGRGDLVATVGDYVITAEELEKPPCGILPVDATRSPRNPSRPRDAWTRVPRLPVRTVRMEARALPTNEKGLRMLLLIHNAAGGRGC